MITWEDIVPKIVLSQTNMEGSQRKYRSQRRFYGKSIVGKWKRNRKTLDEPSEVCDIQCPARKGNWKDQILRRKGHWSWKLEIPRLCNSIRTRRMYKEKISPRNYHHVKSTKMVPWRVSPEDIQGAFAQKTSHPHWPTCELIHSAQCVPSCTRKKQKLGSLLKSSSPNWKLFPNKKIEIWFKQQICRILPGSF